MLVGSIPVKMPVPFGRDAVPPYINTVPIPSQEGVAPGRASFETGFTPTNMTPISAGGVPPFGGDMNGLQKAVTEWLRWLQAGAPIQYDATFQSDIGGYPLGALVLSAGSPSAGFFYFSTVDGNTANPDTGGAGWTKVDISGVSGTGSWTWRPTQEVLPGWVKANAESIGNFGSGASQFASGLALPLFSWLWTNFSNIQCPVSGGRGANAAADFAANKTINVIDMRGYAPIGMDTMGGSPTTRLAGVPPIFGNATQAGSLLGEALHQLITAELAAHNHGITDLGHNHSITDPSHAHSITDPGHNHGVTDHGHSHTGAFTGGAPAQSGFGALTSLVDQVTSTNTTGISIDGNGTGISVDSHTTGISVDSNATGISINNAGSSNAHNTTQLSIVGTHYFKL